jgi:hypothetical protein
VLQESVPHLIQTAIRDGALDSKRPNAVTVRREKLPGWLIESFVIEAQPPFGTYEREYQGRKEFLIEVDPKKIHTDRYWALSTYYMVNHCQHWALSIRYDYEKDLKTSSMKVAPVRCNRLLNPDRSQVYDVIVFTAERGSFFDANTPIATAEKLKDRYKDNKSVYGPGIRLVEPEVASASTVDGFAMTQLQVRRYTYGSTFLHAEFGKRRLYDSYVLMLVSPAVLLAVQTFYPPDLKSEDVRQNLETVLRALYQPAQ